MKTCRFRSLLVIFSACATIGWAPPAAQSSVSLLLHDARVQTNPEATANDVALYFSLLDSAGNPVKDAEVEDFTLTEDGQSAAIASLGLADDEPIHVALLLDTSGSMVGEKIDAARKAAASFISRLQGGDRVAVLTFNTTTTHQIDFTSDQTAAQRVVDLIQAAPNTGTCLYDAVYQTVQMTAETPAGRRALILLTDGVDEYDGNPCSHYSLDDVIALASRGNTRVPIHTIGLGANVDSQSLDRLARETSGRSHYAPSATQLDALFGLLTDQLRSQYVLHYLSSAAAGEHTLTLKAKHLGAQDQASIDIELPALPYNITFVSPVEGAEITEKTTISVTISGQGTLISKVQFLANGVILCADSAAPYECEWDPSGLDDTSVFLEAVAQDAAGNQLARGGVTVMVGEVVPPEEEAASGEEGMSSTTVILLASVGGVILLAAIIAVLVLAGVIRLGNKTRDREWQDMVQGKAAGSDERTMDEFSPNENALGVLVVQQSDDEALIHQRIEIIKSPTTLGRKADNDVIFAKDSPVSRRHAVIEERGGELYLSEVLSEDESGQVKRPAYGTFVNGTQVQDPVRLRHGDEIQLGKRVRIRFETVSGTGADDESTVDQMDSGGDSKTVDLES